MKLSDFDYNLSKKLIAQCPIEPRDASKLLVLKKGIEHRTFSDILDYLESGDTLVLNDSRVIPAKLTGRKSTGGHVEVLVVSRTEGGYECMIRGKNIHEGTILNFSGIQATVLDVIKKPGTDSYLVNFDCNGNLLDILEKIGDAPLPPYIKAKLEDKNRYQTVYSKRKGSIAAPTAGLHFTEKLLEKIKGDGINIAYVTLHVSPGTFTPVKAEKLKDHIMEAEYISISKENADIINNNTGKLIASGTTAVKALESSWFDGEITATEGFSELFIYPPYKFKSKLDGMITNFHLPKSTLLMLVSAFAGKERLMAAYDEAISHSYRFYSFGDAMLVFRP
ncbi:MAG: tRNA preQ1(34) S-adenosylmethionine ribosyltransferase-isomerase QueA [Candidatus Methanoperedens sp.]|nr:tRNA preQ1(34) S-adenosylmethionine ribosyltransferase-isomerase QueA [Candidatus Methanoperedens sp.]MCE8425480.1 tRNA preQ1(34) S-adenosylmethionine ribosyltransferase-isomerase QueA [Candidatus Methanoperedens sp.]MCE8427941.1 tRNA preQ1(34) S-adenosylmethionine ribosyltransferase-isomerase QueA [Candidatus Methanoperedens sp.]